MGVGAAELRAAINISNDDPIPRPLALALRLPAGERSEFESDMARLHREIDLIARLIDRDREVVELHIDTGGMGGSFPMNALRNVSEALRHQFHFSAAVTCEYSVALDSAVIEMDQIADLAANGFNRIHFSAVQIEPAKVRAARDGGFRSIGIVAAGMQAAIERADELGPDRLSVPGPFEYTLALAQRADPLRERLERSGYRYLGLDQFALPHDDLAVAFKEYRLQYGPSGFTTHAECDSIGFGTGAISQVGAFHCQNADSREVWRSELDSGRLPALRGLCLSADDELRGELVHQLFCCRQIRIHELEHSYGIEFRSYFAAELGRLAPCLRLGLVRDFGDRIAVCSRGWPWLRTIALCFDAYANEGTWPREAGHRH